MTQTPGARLSIPNNTHALEMVLYCHDVATYDMYNKYLQECALEEACRIDEHQEGCWWWVDNIGDDVKFHNLN